MATLTVLYWRDIPAQVVAKEGRNVAKRQLDPRFEKAIDRAAMRAGLRDSDSYLAEWRRGTPEPCGDDLAAEAEAAARGIEAGYDEARLRALVESGGREPAEG